MHSSFLGQVVQSHVDNKGIISYRGIAGEMVITAPKEQPPRKLSGQRTAN